MKRKKWVIAFLAVIMSLTTLIAIAACKPEETEAPTKEEGPETGVYYYDAGTEEYQIALNNGDAFTFLVMGENKTGTYTLTGETLELDFARAEDTDLTATLSGDVLTLTYDGYYQHEFSLYWEHLGDPRSKSRVPEQFSHNLSLGYSMKNGRYNISFECRNFTNEKLYDNFSLQKAGRAFYGKFRVYFGS